MFALLFRSAKTEALPAGQKCTLSMCLEDFRLDLQVWWAYRFGRHAYGVKIVLVDVRVFSVGCRESDRARET